MKTLYLKPGDRRAAILAAATLQAKLDGFHTITRAAVASRLGCTAGLINRYFHPVEKLRDAVMQQAIKQQDLAILAAGLALRHPTALRAPAALRTAAAKSLQS